MGQGTTRRQIQVWVHNFRLCAQQRIGRAETGASQTGTFAGHKGITNMIKLWRNGYLYCTNCGAELDNEYTYCPWCGTHKNAEHSGNEPLTFQQVRDRLGCPVWMELEKAKHWCLVNYFDSVTTGVKAVALTDRYGVDFVFQEHDFESGFVKVYDRKPDENAERKD